MEVEISLGKEDIKKYFEYMFTENRSGKKKVMQFRIIFFIISVITGIISIFLIFEILNGYTDFFQIIFSLVLIVSFCILLYHSIFFNKYLKMMIRSFERSNKYKMKFGRNLGDSKLILKEEGLISFKDSFELKIKWNGIKQIVEVQEYIYLFINEEDAIIIPKRSF
ncbi:MAG: YcxB family protein [Thermoplasmatota archaeon]